MLVESADWRIINAQCTCYRFDKLGNDILLAVHVLTETYENDNVFRGVCRDVINRHVEGGRHLDPALWKQFCSIWVAWLESKGVKISADQKAAWDTLSVTFNEECQKHLAALGQPHL
ncbi:hypothetical protein OESDEN_01721 [Oesophagostomum dentatum]|uniref:Globin domain-containing protein n=1 Tax=Oesophagostomum dentatum TaxID=61180 RepID=A0A0B1TM17_OESDE|nr:hypothetical protein OESDEN_01721 [Oesophagostomum dentatum]